MDVDENDGLIRIEMTLYKASRQGNFKFEIMCANGDWAYPSNERGGNRQANPNAPASHLDSTACSYLRLPGP